MMNPEVYTEKGIRAQATAERVIGEICAKYKLDVSWIEDHKDTDRPRLSFDGFLSKNNKAIGIFEARTRNAELQNGSLLYNGKAYDTVIVTTAKIEECARYCKAFNLPLYFFIILNNATLMFTLVDKRGEVLLQAEQYVSTTQATINGGEKTRLNSYLKIKDAKVMREFSGNGVCAGEGG